MNHGTIEFLKMALGFYRFLFWLSIAIGIGLVCADIYLLLEKP